MSSNTRLLRIVTVGHVDHGKSTLVGRLLHDTGNLLDGRLEAVQAVCKAQGKPFEYAFLLDALEEERDQGITIDTAQVWLDLDDRNVTMIDIELDHRWRLSETLSTIERIAYRFEDDSAAGDTHGWDVRAGFEYATSSAGKLT